MALKLLGYITLVIGEDYQAETWKINHSRKHIEDWTVEFIANTAKEMGHEYALCMAILSTR